MCQKNVSNIEHEEIAQIYSKITQICPNMKNLKVTVSPQFGPRWLLTTNWWEAHLAKRCFNINIKVEIIWWNIASTFAGGDQMLYPSLPYGNHPLAGLNISLKKIYLKFESKSHWIKLEWNLTWRIYRVFQKGKSNLVVSITIFTNKLFSLLF